jgi:predicted TIM-barrel fold metal-dependent hydrolase
VRGGPVVVSEVIEAFGPERCMLASNFPVEGLAKSYSEVWANFAECLSSYSEDERDLLFWRNALRFYRIGLDPDARPRAGG